MTRKEKPSADPVLGAEVDRCLQVLRKGGVILYPTDTVWGLGCDATDEAAVARIGRIKGRAGKSYIVLLDSSDKLERYVPDVPPAAWELIDNADTPLTLIYPRGVQVVPGVAGDDGSLAIRITAHPFCRELVRRLGRPLVSTSANVSGEPYPASFADIGPAILSQVDYVVNLPAEKSRKGKPSAVIRLYADGSLKVLRK